MKDQQLKYGIGGLLIGGILVWFLMTSAVNNNSMGIMQMMGIRYQTNNSNSMMGASIDRQFIEQMIPHHEDALTMARLAESKAQKPEIKQLAKNILKTQQEEIDEMKSWYKTWYGNDVPEDVSVMNIHGMGKSGNMHMGMMGEDDDIQTLENAENFDKAFIEEMIPHHQMAVMMSNMLLHGTNRPEMKQLAKNIISAQTTEINDMRTWYKEWGY